LKALRGKPSEMKTGLSRKGSLSSAVATSVTTVPLETGLVNTTEPGVGAGGDGDAGAGTDAV